MLNHDTLKRAQSRAGTAEARVRTLEQELAEARRDRREASEEAERQTAIAEEQRQRADGYQEQAGRYRRAEDERAALEIHVDLLHGEVDGLTQSLRRALADFAADQQLRAETAEALRVEQQAHNRAASELHNTHAELVATRAALAELREQHEATLILHVAELAERDPKDLRGRIERLRAELAADRAELIRLRAEKATREAQSMQERLLPAYALGQGLRVVGARKAKETKP